MLQYPEVPFDLLLSGVCYGIQQNNVFCLISKSTVNSFMKKKKHAVLLCPNQYYDLNSIWNLLITLNYQIYTNNSFLV